MKYKNAIDLLPEKLLKEIQKYVCGEAIYIPQIEGKHKAWGETSGSRMEIKKRNHEIRKKFTEGAEIYKLAEEYYLAVETIKKIVYT